MDFTESPDHKLLRGAVSDVVKQFPDEYWREKDAKEEFPREFWDQMAKSGWFGVNIPEKYGGSGLGIQEVSVAIHETARAGAGVPGGDLLMRTLVFAAQTILDFGTEDMKDRFVPKLARGEVICSFAHTEPDAGVNTFAIKTYAEDQGEYFVLKGQKVWITLAHMADIMLVVARTKKPEEVLNKPDGLSLLLIEPKQGGVRTTRIPDMPMKPLGSNLVYFDNMKVPKANLLGERDNAWKILPYLLNSERISTASMSIGTGELVLNRAVKYAQERVVFGRPIGTNQAIQFPLAHARAELEAAWLMTQKAAWLFDQRQNCALEANVAAYLGARAAFNAADRALQTLGGMGYAREYDVERHWRDIRLFRSAPIPEEMVLNYLGQHVLGLPRSY